MKEYNLAIIGTGPAGLMCAVKLVDNGIKNILMLEKGKLRSNNDNENVTEGFGGASPFSDGKNLLTHKAGGTLSDLIDFKRFYNLIHEQDELWLRFKTTDEQKKRYNVSENYLDIDDRLFKPNEKTLKFRAKALAHNLDLQTYDIRHWGSDSGYFMVENIYKYLIDNGVDIINEYEVNNLQKHNETFIINEEYHAKNVLVAIGRSGGHFFKRTMESFNIPIKTNGIDIGVRCEMPREIGEKLISYNLYEPKFVSYNNRTKTKVRSFCYCGDKNGGFVALEEYRDTGIKTVNGHSYADRQSDNLNFAVLATETMTEPFNDPQAYAESICKLVNLLAGDNVLVQRLGDIRAGRRSTPKRIKEGATVPTLMSAVPGDLTLCIPKRQMDAIIDLLEKIDKVMPGVASDHTLLYGMEVKFYSNRVDINEDSMTIIDGLYVAGDGSGITRSLSQASAQGIMVADGILRKN
jgi:uncharacterized protein